jgi:hypothetical protein
VCRSAECREKRNDGEGEKAGQNRESENSQVRPSSGARLTTGCPMLSANAMGGRRKNGLPTRVGRCAEETLSRGPGGLHFRDGSSGHSIF